MQEAAAAIRISTVRRRLLVPVREDDLELGPFRREVRGVPDRGGVFCLLGEVFTVGENLQLDPNAVHSDSADRHEFVDYCLFRSQLSSLRCAGLPNRLVFLPLGAQTTKFIIFAPANNPY